MFIERRGRFRKKQTARVPKLRAAKFGTPIRGITAASIPQFVESGHESQRL